MLASVRTVALWGIEALPVTVEVDVGDGLPRTSIVGLPDSTVRESLERLAAAFRHSDLELPAGRVTVNLSPTDLRKSGSHFDLPIAVALALAGGLRARIPLDDLVFLGELALDGSLRAVSGVLPAARWALRAGARAVVVPAPNGPEAASGGIPAWPIRDLAEILGILCHGGEVPPAPTPHTAEPMRGGDLAEVRGQAPARRAVEVAAAGAHNLLLVGPPGSGKTLLARRLPGLLPPLAREEAVDATCVHSAAGLLRPGDGLLPSPPFRAPHHTVSASALVGGGGAVPRPGEVSLAHHGVLFLDEFAEFRRDALEGLRQPLEEGRSVITRARFSVTFPARFALVAAMNPCPCGHAGDPTRPCRCGPHQVELYRRRISGPLLDRIDIQIEVPRVRVEDLTGREPGEATAPVARRVARARNRQLERQGTSNGLLGLKETERWCRPLPEGQRLLERALEQFGLSARAYHRVLRVARTLADLDGAATIRAGHVAEAVQYRAWDRGAGRD